MSAFSSKRRAEVSNRADHRCEYCHLPSRGQVATFPIDHIIPKSLGGSNNLDNLALTCPHCNAQKWCETSAIDPASGHSVFLFNPRTQVWIEHFEWSVSGELIGRSAVGRVTIAQLQMNDPEMIELRVLLGRLGLLPEPKPDG